jgi:hypothetical protein
VTAGKRGPAVAWDRMPGAEAINPLKDPDVSDTQMERRIQGAALLAWSFTGGRGLSDDRRLVHPEVAEVIRTSVVRSPNNVALPLALDAPFSAGPGSFTDSTLPQTAVLVWLRLIPGPR